jgi:hypothetical protein
VIAIGMRPTFVRCLVACAPSATAGAPAGGPQGGSAEHQDHEWWPEVDFREAADSQAGEGR